MTTSQTFAFDLAKACEKAKAKTEIAARKIIIELFKSVISKSPVDTGRFRANWVVGYGSASIVTTKATDQRQVGDKTGPTIDHMALRMNKSPLDGTSVYLTNSLPYSHVLEFGRANGKPGSAQAPAGMVRISLVEITNQYGA